ncbi:MAG TPA: glycosyl hydrolase-related protein [bacterium]|nr:glycosyl hydrolase-related protein [bacterium]
MAKKVYLIIPAIFAFVLMAQVALCEVSEIYLTPHFHYDPVFEKDQNDYTDIGLDRCRRFMEALETDPDYAVVFSEIDYLKPYFDVFPEKREMLLDLIANNRIETGGSYNEPNEMTISGEGIIRNIMYGRGYHEGVLGDRRAQTYQSWDVFGHTIQLSQILAKTRYTGAMWRKGNPPCEKYVGITVPGLTPDFWNLAPDGTLLHHRREHYKAVSNTVSEEDLINKVIKKKKVQDSLGLRAEFGALSSDDFAYPETWLAGHCTSLEKNDLPIHISGPTAYMDVIKKYDSAKLPVISRDFSLYHVGTALSRVNFKIGNRVSEVALIGAEKFGTVAALMGARYPAPALDKAWRQLLFNQHHDGITGTCCDRSYFDLMGGFREAAELGTEAYVNSLDYIASEVDTSGAPAGSAPIVVFNQLGWKRTDIVVMDCPDVSFGGSSRLVDDRGADVPFEVMRSNGRKRIKFVAADVPAVGYRTYYMLPGGVKSGGSQSLSAGGETIGNEFYSVTVDPSRGGGISRLIDRQTGREIISPADRFVGNELIVMKEGLGPQYTAWELDVKEVRDYSGVHRAKVTSRLGESSAALISEGEVPGLGGYRQEIRLYPGVKRIDFVTTILNPRRVERAEDRDLWMVRFPAELKGTAPVIEDRFYAAARRRSLKPLSYRTDLDKMHTLSAPYSALRWAEEGTAVRLDVTDRDGKLVDSESLMLCEIVHSRGEQSVAFARQLQKALVTRGVTCTPSFGDENRNVDLLSRNFRFVIDIAGDNPYAVELLDYKKFGDKFRELVKKSGSAKILTIARANDIDIRKIETLLISATDSAAMRKEISEMSESIVSKMRIELKTNEDARGKKNRSTPDDYGIALLNRGNLLHSFDNNGTIVMGLYQVAPWAMVQMGMPFGFPEDKNHRFVYSLYPHEGDWRDARTYRAGHDFNSPLVAVGGKAGNSGKLPASSSFFDIRADSAVLTSIKPVGNELASMKTGAVAGPHNGVALRFYEAEGRNESVTVKFFRPLRSAHETNMLEEAAADAPALDISNGDTLVFSLTPNEVKTIVVEFEQAAPPAADSQVLARDREAASVLYSNYWDYNLGAAYMYNSPVSVSLGFPLEEKLPDPEMVKMRLVKKKADKIKKGKNRLRLTVSNGSADERLKGRLLLMLPDGWESEPGNMDIDLAPLEGRRIDLDVNATRPANGFITAVVQSGGTAYFDNVPIGKKAELDASAKIIRGSMNDTLEVRINNNQGGVIAGEVIPVGPVETWPAAIAGDYSLVEMGVRAQSFMIEPDVEKTIRFDIRKTGLLEKNNYWFMVKVLYNGYYKYLPVVEKD